MSTVSGRTLTDSVIGVLTDADLVVGDGVAPDDGGWQGAPGQSAFVPFAVVHAVAGGSTDGPLGEPDEFGESLIHVTGVGSTREQAEWVADVARSALITPGAVAQAGRSVSIVRVDSLGGCRRDDDPEPPEWLTGDRFRIFTTT